jgi:hypothetical protein
MVLSTVFNLNDSFQEFLETQPGLSQEQKHEMIEFFKEPIVRETVVVSLSLVLWSILYSFIDLALLGSGVVYTLVDGFSLLKYLPWILMTLSNFLVKSILFAWFTHEGTYTKKQHYLAAVPSIGVFLFLADVFKENPLFYTTLKSYLKYARKRGVRFIIKLARTNIKIRD